MDKRRIQRIIKAREKLFDARRAELAEADLALDEAKELQRIAEERELLAITAMTSEQEISGSELQALAQIAVKAVQQTSEAKGVVLQRTVVREERQEAVFQAKRDVKVLEAVETRIVERIRLEELRFEQADMDETAARIREAGNEARPSVDSNGRAHSSRNKTG